MLLIISIFFPVRHVFLTKEAYLIGEYSDFTSFSLYLSDILIFITFVLVLFTHPREFWDALKLGKWLIFAVFLGFLVHFSLNTRLNAYLFIRWVELIVAYGTFVVIIKEFEPKTQIYKLFAWLCGLEAIIALIQFITQKSIGLYKLGEEHIGLNIVGIAKIVSGETSHIRAYGTFPHPNALSALLVAGIFVILDLILTANTLKSRIIYYILLFLNILALTVTFSRGAYVALAFGLIIFFGLIFWSRIKKNPVAVKTNRVLIPIIMTLTFLLASFLIFRPYIMTRATFSDAFTVNRKLYDVTGVKMALKNPIFGIGLGESLLHMEQYSGKTLQLWEKQPVHNYFIIAAAEIGIPAALILLWIFLQHLWLLTKRLTSEPDSSIVTRYSSLLAILISFLALMQFDHYFYTLDQTQLLLWFILAMIAAELKNPQKGDLPKP